MSTKHEIPFTSIVLERPQAAQIFKNLTNKTTPFCMFKCNKTFKEIWRTEDKYYNKNSSHTFATEGFHYKGHKKKISSKCCQCQMLFLCPFLRAQARTHYQMLLFILRRLQVEINSLYPSFWLKTVADKEVSPIKDDAKRSFSEQFPSNNLLSLSAAGSAGDELTRLLLALLPLQSLWKL